eukprot:gene14664-22331_t
MRVNTEKSECVLLCPPGLRPRRGAVKPGAAKAQKKAPAAQKAKKGAVRYLGVTIDEELSFRQHIQRLRSALARQAGFVKYLSGSSWGCTRRTLRTMHLAYVQSK